MEVIASVRDQYNTYTARAEGKTASYTGGQRGAVERLAAKIFGEHQRVTVTEIAPKDGERISYWRITTDPAQACRVCGCTWDKGCEGGCHWVEADLCSHCANPTPAPNPRDGMTVELEDHGQDFLEFDIKDGRIVETRPFQANVWNSMEVLNEALEVGHHIAVRTHRSGVRTFNYPVAAVRPLVQQETA